MLPVGERLPLHLGSAGKIFLADMSAEEVDAFVAETGAIRLATGRAVGVDELKATLVHIRHSGFAVPAGERNVGISSVMAPVRATDNALLAVVGVTGPTDAIDTSTQNALITEVRRAAAALGTRAPVVTR